jgi:predicted transcriptional regulator
MSTFTHIAESKQFIDAKDWSRDEINEWLNTQGIFMSHQTHKTEAIKEDL